VNKIELYKKIVENGDCESSWCKDCSHNDGITCSLHVSIRYLHDSSKVYYSSFNKMKHDYCVEYLHTIREKKLKRILDEERR